MRYVSTRGQAPTLGFLDATLAGLARDGGLYTPATIPAIAPGGIAALAGLSYATAAARLVAPFVGEDLGAATLADMAGASYKGFRHAATAPLVQIGDNLFLLELFHGPTLAFKDFAMQWLGRLIGAALEKRGSRATIVGATSGDTGAAAIEAFGGGARTDVFILFPHGRVSDVQRRQMTTVDRPGVHAIAIEGAFDDCQDIVKALFNDLSFRDELALSGVNSINWARILAQIVYYFTSAVALGAPGRKVSFAVPTGNFGDILAGYYAKRMGLPIERLIVATNENDILARALASGVYRPQGVKPTQSPSMDIQVSSNFERLLFEAYGRDAEAVRAAMASLKQSGEFTISCGASGGDPQGFRRRPRLGDRVRGGNGARAQGERDHDRSTYRDWRRRRARRAQTRSGDACCRAGDSPSRQIPGGGRARDRHAPRASAAAAGPARAQGTGQRSAERRARRRRFHPRARQGDSLSARVTTLAVWPARRN